MTEGLAGLLEKYGGPHLTAGLQNLTGLARMIGPQADVMDLMEFSRASGDAFKQGNLGEAAGNFGLAAATIPMMALPGSVGAIRRGSKTVLPDDVTEAFSSLGSAQRGAPEKAMLRVQNEAGGGVLNPLVEHVGDLTHRMSHMAQYGNTGKEFVKEKVEKTLVWLKSPYGFEREMGENLAVNAEMRGIPTEEIHSRVSLALEAYTKEHRKLPVYNRAQWLAREAAVAIGEKRFSKATGDLERLKAMLDLGTFDQQAFQFFRNKDGSLKKFTTE